MNIETMRKIKEVPITRKCNDEMEMNYHGVEDQMNLRQTTNAGMLLSVGKIMRGVFGSKVIDYSLPGRF